jgi:hypothetical protein
MDVVAVFCILLFYQRNKMVTDYDSKIMRKFFFFTTWKEKQWISLDPIESFNNLTF